MSRSGDNSPQAPVHVLYLHHAGAFGGASRSLLELIAAFPAGSVAPRVIVPRGAVPLLLRDSGIAVREAIGISQFDCTRYGHYRGLRGLILLRELCYLPFTLSALLSARRRWPDIDAGIRRVLQQADADKEHPNFYGNGHAAEKIADALQSMHSN